MSFSLHHKTLANYWLKVFALYALAEACIQLLFYTVLNNFGTKPISIIEFHLVMWIAQCLMIWPIWWVASLVRKQSIFLQIIVNLAFYVVYSYWWFGPVQDIINYCYNNLQELTRLPGSRLQATLDKGYNDSYIKYQLLKHAFRLSWFYLAAYFYHYRRAEKARQELAVANKELQLKMLKWQLNPSFYFKTIHHLLQVANVKPANATSAILQLAQIMEYVIYEAKEKLVDVKKEIQFINTYTQLINQQNDNVQFETTVSGSTGQLKISPLLLAGFIDKIAVANNAAEKSLYTMQLHFSGNKLLLQISSNAETENLLAATEDVALNKQLQELYPSKFMLSTSGNNKNLTLSLLLHNER
jgi:hypothetical protein